LAFLLTTVCYLVVGGRTTPIDFLPDRLRQELNLTGKQTEAQRQQHYNKVQRYNRLFETDDVLRTQSTRYEFLSKLSDFLDALPRWVLCPGLAVAWIGFLCETVLRKLSGTKFMQNSINVGRLAYFAFSAIAAMITGSSITMNLLAQLCANGTGENSDYNNFGILYGILWIPISLWIAYLLSLSKDPLTKKSALVALAHCLVGLMLTKFVMSIGEQISSNDSVGINALFVYGGCGVVDLLLLCLVFADAYQAYAVCRNRSHASPSKYIQSMSK